MKRFWYMALCVILLLGACSVPPETSTAPPPPESSSVPSSTSSSQPELNYFVEKVEDNGIEDREAVDALYWYLYENLTPSQYLGVAVSHSALYPIETYLVYFSGPDKAPAEKLLETYTGSWAPVYFEVSHFTQAEMMRAETDAKYFLKMHPEIVNALVIREDLEDSILLLARKPSDDLEKFVENYPLKDIFWISVEDPDLLNPD